MEHSAVLLTCIKLPYGFKTFVLSILEWPLKTGFTLNAQAVKSSRVLGLVFGPSLYLKRAVKALVGLGECRLKLTYVHCLMKQ